MNSEDRKTILSALFLATIIVLLGTAFYGVANDDVPALRKFRPVKMAEVKVANPSVKVEVPRAKVPIPDSIPVSIEPMLAKNKASIPNAVADAAKAADLGWMYFEQQKWGSAQDWFITALEWDASSVESAKGLVMSIYYSGATGDAYQLGRELGTAMPEIRAVVPDAVAGEVKIMLEASKWEEAENLLKQFPATDPRFVAIVAGMEKSAKGDSGKMASTSSITNDEETGVVEFTLKSRAKQQSR